MAGVKVPRDAFGNIKIDQSYIYCPCPARRHDDPWHLQYLDLDNRLKEQDRRARYRGFRGADHFLELAGERGPTEGVVREYRIIFMGDPLDRRPFPVVSE